MNEFVRKVLALPEPASSVANAVDELHALVLGVTLLGALVVGVAAVAFVVRYRRRAPNEQTPVVVAPISIEVAWIASLLALFLLFWFIGNRLFIRMSVAPRDSMEVYVTAKQWMWKFAHPEGRSSVSVLTVPVGRPVRLTMTSRDVIHSFAVPEFRIKQDVLPGRYTTVWFEATAPGVYPILCTEYCGTGHSVMRGEVVVLSAEAYDRWLEWAPETEPEPEVASMIAAGREASVRHACFACHTVDGRRHVGPTWLGLFGAERPLREGPLAVADPAYLTESMMDPQAKLVVGFEAVMPSYRGVLNSSDAAAIVEYIRSLRDAPPPTDQHPPPEDTVIPGATTLKQD